MKILNSRPIFRLPVWLNFFFIIVFVAAAQASFGQSSTIDSANVNDKQLVRQAVLDYVEGIYNFQPARIENSVHTELVKRGFNKKRGETNYSLEPMTFQELIEMTKTPDASEKLPENAPKDVEVYDVMDRTASAKLTALWGIDYMFLIKHEGKWKIIQVLWQGKPVSGILLWSRRQVWKLLFLTLK